MLQVLESDKSDQDKKLKILGISEHSETSKHQDFWYKIVFPPNRRKQWKLKRFRCSLCSFSCTKEAKIIVHNRSHTGERPFQCRFCDACFARKDVAGRHENIHFKDRK